jgi:hypothetical protein
LIKFARYGGEKAAEIFAHACPEMMYVICSSVPIVEWVVINSVTVSWHRSDPASETVNMIPEYVIINSKVAGFRKEGADSPVSFG